MTNQTTERMLAKRATRAMRNAALRLALARVARESDPTLAYGCVDWFRYDAPPQPEEADTAGPPAAAHPGAGRGEASLRY